ncbi:MAG: hypothetical protein R3Y54_03915 [Eubacteriales bacterium]
MAIEYEYIHDWGGKGVYAWHGTAMQIQQIRLRQGNVLLLSLCEASDYDEWGENMTSYFTEELAKWFYQKVVPLCYGNRTHLSRKRLILQSCKRFIDRVNQEFLRYQDRHNRNQIISCSILLLLNHTYLIVQVGNLECTYLTIPPRSEKLQFFQKRQKSPSYLGVKDLCVPIVKKGILRRKAGIIMYSPSFFQGTPISTFGKQYMRMRTSQARMQKLLSEIGTRNRNKNQEEQMEAIMVWRR